MRMSLGGLKTVLNDSVVELMFRRRRFKAGYTEDRRMLCTNSRALLDSISGKVALRFRAPTHPPKFNANARGLVTAWDIMWCDYRNISTESHDVISIMPVRNEEEMNKFWEYFNDYLSKLPPAARAGFSNR